MRPDIRGQINDSPRVRLGFIGCGGHSFRNIYPTFQFAPIDLIATCDLNADRAAAYAKQFGADRSYTDHREMLAKEPLDAVFIVTNYDDQGRPRYVKLATDCVKAGRHVWMEKPPAQNAAELQELKKTAGDLNVMVGLKKMFFPANEKAHELASSPAFGKIAMATLQYPERIPTLEEFARYHRGERVWEVVGFLDHLCHPMSLLIFLMGMPQTLFYERAESGAGVATFTYADGRLANFVMAHGLAGNGGMERTTLISGTGGGHILVDNNLRVAWHRDAPGRGYGTSPTYYVGTPEQTSSVWEPEFSLGQLYNKGLFLLGYAGEVTEFATAILEKRRVKKAHLDHAIQVTQIFEAFAQGPGKTIQLPTSDAG